MPSPEGDLAAQLVDGSHLDPSDNSPPKLQLEPSPKFCPENGAKVARINAKRKPDKSKIFRIRTNENDDQLSCSLCNYEATSKDELENHILSCGREDPHPILPSEEIVRDNPPDEYRRHQDVANNNKAHLLKSPQRFSGPNSRDSSVERTNGYDSDANQPESGPLSQIRELLQQSSHMPITQQLAQSNMALEAIQNARMALAQFASNAIGNGQPSSPQAMQEMAVLQSTLYTLQHQQMMQLQLIQQLQAQLSIKNKDNHPSSEDAKAEEELPKGNHASQEEQSPPPSPSNTPHSTDNPPTSSATSSFFSSLMERFKSPKKDEPKEKTPPNGASLAITASAADQRERPLSPPMTASSIASSVIQHSDPPPTDEPNTLEMLQRTANQVLNNASQGLLTNRLIDDYNKPPEGKDSYYKHRCRYCGKVFGSDSALQIHVRSHTGERPFKCNICGNRFTTKGNLKVHFQRHSGRFPHVKMNPHPVPEHLDKFHPPLLAQLGELKDYPTPPTGPPNPFSPSPVGPSIPPFRLTGPPPPPPPLPPLDLHKPFNPEEILRRGSIRHNKDEPENLSNRNESRKSPEPHKSRRGAMNMEVDDEPFPDHKRNKTNQDLDEIDSRINVGREEKLEEISKHNFRDPLHEVLRNSLRDPMSEKLKETLRNTIQDFRDSLRESSKEKLEDSSFEMSKERSRTPKDSIKDMFQDSNRNSPRGSLSSEQILDKNAISEREDYSGTPLDIRIKAEQDLKDSNEPEKNVRDERETDNTDTPSPGSDQPTDLRMRPLDFRPLGFPNIPFPGPRMPLSFPILPGLSPPFQASSAPSTPCSMASGVDPAKDPTIYTNLLPRPGSSDNSWEALIEIEKASETMKLEQLVNNIEHKVSDPNQCIICHRVLSCKSALQMHYRTHTGERPFKCKICGRAFTTKGNLKTHMGVHRAKPPMRMLHQCPVCHKKYTNALVLQQHIRLHTGEPTDLTPEQIAAAEVRDYPPSLPVQTSLHQMLPGGFPLPPQPLYGFPPIPLHLRYQLSPEMLRRHEDESSDKRDDEEKYLRPFSTSSRSSSAGSAEQRTAEDLSLRLRNEENMNGSSPRQSVSPTPSDYSDIGDRSHENQMEALNHLGERFLGTSGLGLQGTADGGLSLASNAPLDLAPRPPPQSLFSPFGIFPPSLTSTQMNAGTPSFSFSNMNPLCMPNIPGRGNTTCHMCFKTFACQSALEIHYRSHTKERPYKCNGNMKQHMLTHKIREGQGHSDGAKSGSARTPGQEETNANSTADATTDQRSGTPGTVPLPLSDPSIPPPCNLDMPSLEEKDEDKSDSGIKRERDGEPSSLPVPKRSTASAEDDVPVEGETPSELQREPPLLSPEVPPSQLHRSHTPLNTSSHPSTSAPHLPPSLSLPSPISLPSSLPLPPSLTLPSSHALPPSLSLPMSFNSSLFPTASLGISSAQPLPHS